MTTVRKAKDQQVDEATISEHFFRLMQRRCMPIQISDVFVLITRSQDPHTCKTVLWSPFPTSRHDLQCTDTLRFACTIYSESHVELRIYYQRAGMPELRWNTNSGNTCNLWQWCQDRQLFGSNGATNGPFEGTAWWVHVDPVEDGWKRRGSTLPKKASEHLHRRVASWTRHSVATAHMDGDSSSDSEFHDSPNAEDECVIASVSARRLCCL